MCFWTSYSTAATQHRCTAAMPTTLCVPAAADHWRCTAHLCSLYRHFFTFLLNVCFVLFYPLPFFCAFLCGVLYDVCCLKEFISSLCEGPVRDLIAFLLGSVWSLSGFTSHSTPISLFTFLQQRFLSHAYGMSGSEVFNWGRWSLWEDVRGDFVRSLCSFPDTHSVLMSTL